MVVNRSFTVRVDHDVCVGNGMCRVTSPNVFVANEHGQSIVADAMPEDLETVLEAAANCPVGAIFVQDAHTNETIDL